MLGVGLDVAELETEAEAEEVGESQGHDLLLAGRAIPDHAQALLVMIAAGLVEEVGELLLREVDLSLAEGVEVVAVLMILELPHSRRLSINRWDRCNKCPK